MALVHAPAVVLPISQKEAQLHEKYLQEQKSTQATIIELPQEVDTAALAASIDLSASHLISSPYADIGNQLTLSELELPYKLFALALPSLSPIRTDYATGPYLDIFDWPTVFSLLRELSHRAGYKWQTTTFYVVIFRSRLKADIDRARLGELDQRSHEEACASGGLLKYWFGSPDAERRNLATCLWRSHADAVAGGAGPWHRQARLAARTMYESIEFHVHALTVEEDARNWRLEAWR